MNWTSTNAVVRRALRAAPEGTFDGDEILVEVEEAGVEGDPGALIVTDRRIAFVSAPVRASSRPRVLAVPLLEVASVEVGRRVWGEYPLVLHLVRERDGEEGISVSLTSGGLERARELAASIARTLEGGDGHAESPPDLPAEVPVAVTVGAGVEAYVSERGGSLWVWTNPEALSDLTARCACPDGVAFALYEDVTGLKLHLSEDLLWFGRIELTLSRLGRRVKARVVPVA